MRTPRLALAGLVCVATVAASTLAPATGDTSSPTAARKARGITPFAYTATVYGTKVILGNVESHTLTDGALQLPCTRRAGISRTRPSLLSTANLPGDLASIVSISATRSTSTTYARGSRHGVRGVSTIADVALGGTLPGGVETPKLVIQGLQSVADSYYDRRARGGRGAFGQKHGFGFRGMSLRLPQGGPVPTQELQALLDALNGSLTPATSVVNDVIATLTKYGVIEIPGLGSIALGQSSGRAGRSSANANAYALRILVDATGEDLRLQLGRAYSRISRPVPAGVFRTVGEAMELSALNGALTFGNLRQTVMDCEGTDGRVHRSHLGSASLLSPVLPVIKLADIFYAERGVQRGSKARGWTSTSVGSVSVPALDLVVTGLRSRVAVASKRPGSRVKRTPSFSISRIVVDGRSLPVPRPGRSVRFPGGVLTMGVLSKSNYYGVNASAARLTLTDLDVSIDLASAKAQVFYR